MMSRDHGRQAGGGSGVYFPIASNAHALVAGAAIATVRRRLKVASLLYDQVFIEAGTVSTQAGPTGASQWRVPREPGVQPTWQSAKERGGSSSFSVSIAPAGTELHDGIPSQLTRVLQSETTISWKATLDPFERELPTGCDWVQFGGFSPLGEEPADRVRKWKWADKGNPALQRLVPDSFVRSRIVDDTSVDVVTGVTNGLEVSIDKLHSQVVAARLDTDSAFSLHGFALPFLIPDVKAMDWAAVAVLRRDKALVRLRAVLREIESEAMVVARTNGDLEREVNRAYRRKFVSVTEEVSSIGSIVAMGAVELAVGVGAGFATMGLGYLGAAIGAVPTVVSSGLEARKLVRKRQANGWIGMTQSIERAASGA